MMKASVLGALLLGPALACGSNRSTEPEKTEVTSTHQECVSYERELRA